LVENDPTRADAIDNMLGALDEKQKNETPPVLIPSIELPKLEFGELPVEHVPINNVHYIIRTFDEALPIFKRAKTILEKALKFFVLDGYVTENVNTAQQLSRLYQILIFFEPDLERKIAMHMRRSSILEAIIDELNENIYMGTLKQLVFELGEIHVEIFELLQAKAQRRVKVPSIKRMNQACTDSIKFLNRFCGYFNKDRSKGGYKQQINYLESSSVDVEEENRPAFIRAHLSLARMYYNLQNKDPIKLSEHLSVALKEYKFLIMYQQELGVKGVEQEISMAKQMASMLPVKIEDLRNRTM